MTPEQLAQLNGIVVRLRSPSEFTRTRARLEAAVFLEALAASPTPATEPGVSGVEWATEDQKAIGWTLNFQWLEKLTNQIENDTGYTATMEVVEAAFLAGYRATPPTSPASVWQTMDSAPKDGSEFLAKCGDFLPTSCFFDGRTFVHYDHDDGLIAYPFTAWLSYEALVTPPTSPVTEPTEVKP